MVQVEIACQDYSPKFKTNRLLSGRPPLERQLGGVADPPADAVAAAGPHLVAHVAVLVGAGKHDQNYCNKVHLVDTHGHAVEDEVLLTT